jgi:DNA segregation ATPase FtsK/SpoIIIE-like protein
MAEASSDFPTGKLFALLRESRWLLLVAGALYFTVALYGYDSADPAWSHSVTGAQTVNPGGVLGAYLSDLLFYLLGVSAWWWVLFMLQRVWAGYRELRADSIFCKRTFLVSASGFVVLLLASSSLEALRLHTLKVALPYAPGGMIGNWLSVAAGPDRHRLQPVQRIVLAAFCGLVGCAAGNLMAMGAPDLADLSGQAHRCAGDERAGRGRRGRKETR